ncbi:MAG: hypothetical protein E7052_01450 [Lentisphaerae bacterium]|nr:hypothetical protein [Lentisphaerota bacterium]
MKKSLFLAAALALSAVPVPAALQYSLQTGTGEAWFAVDTKQTVYVDVKKLDGSSVAIGDSVISNIGWYNYDDVASYRGNQGGRPGRPGRPGSNGGNSGSAAMPQLHYGDMKSGVLGEFSPGDKIVLWVETTSGNGKKETFTMYSPTTQDSDIWMLGTSGESIIFNWGDFGVDYGKKSQNALNPAGFEFAISTSSGVPTSGQPLPGIIATLIIGGGTLVYLKKRKKLYGAQ